MKNAGPERGDLRRKSLEKMAARDEEEKKRPLTPTPEDEERMMTDLEDEPPIPAPPDGGWGWVIVIASFMCNLIVDGIAYSFGIFFLTFVDYFQDSKSKTAWVGSLLNGIYAMTGPIASALTNKFGCRPVTIAGSIIASISFILAQYSPNIDYLMLTYGLFGGFGFGLIYLPAIVSVGYYFEKKRSLATGIAVCGSGVGTFLFAPFSQFLLEQYGWKGSLLIMAGLILNCMVMGALMRPLEAPPISQLAKPLLQRMADEKKFQMQRGSIAISQYFMVQLPDGTMERRAKIPFNLEPGVHSSLNLDQSERPLDVPVTALPTIAEGKDIATPTNGTDAPQAPIGIPKNKSLPMLEGMARRNLTQSANGTIKMSQSNQTMDGNPRRYSLNQKMSNSGVIAPMQSKNNNGTTEEVWVKVGGSQSGSTSTVTQMAKSSEKKDFARPMYRKDIFYSGSIANLKEFTRSQRDMDTYRASVVSIPKSTVTVQQEPDGGYSYQVEPIDPDEKQIVCWCLALPRSMTDTMAAMMDFSLLKNPVFLLIGISNVFGMLGFYVPFVYITDFAGQLGATPDKAAFLLSIIGITNTVGRLFFGWLTDRPSVDALLVNNVCLTLSGVAVFIIPFCTNYVLVVVVCVCFGLFIAAYISLTSIILVELLGLDKLTNSFGLLILFRGSAALVGSPFAGAMYDLTEDYTLPFCVAGGLIVFSALLSFFIPCIKRWSENSQSRVARPKFRIEPDGDGVNAGETSI